MDKVGGKKLILGYSTVQNLERWEVRYTDIISLMSLDLLIDITYFLSHHGYGEFLGIIPVDVFLQLPD